MHPHSEGIVCHCGQTFSQPGHLAFHQKTCRTTKLLFEDALDKAKGFFKGKNLRRILHFASHSGSSKFGVRCADLLPLDS